LVILDIYSRYVWVFPLTNKDTKSVLNKFKSFKKLPENIWTDLGGEYTNTEFKNWCKKNNINLYHTGGESKAVFAERFNRTLKSSINAYMIESNTDKYIDILNELVEGYNNKIHSSIGEKPNDVYFENVKPKVEIIFNASKNKPKFKVGDFVRISRVKNVFEKGYTNNFTEEVFKIIEVDKKEYPYLYQLEDLLNEKIKGKFYEEELQKTELKDYAIVEKVLQTKTVKGVKNIL
jgi:hypothetical protein